jgi:hypothetical protein
VQPKTERGAAAAPNTSINHQVTEEQQQREISEVIAEQDRQALSTDDRQRFAMFAEWELPESCMATQLKIAGLPADSLTDELVSGFKGFFVAKPSTVDTAAGWCFRLVTWVKRERVNAAGTTSSVASDDFDDENTEWMNGGSK